LHEQPARDHSNDEVARTQAASLFEGDYGEPSAADSFCFMRDMRPSKSEEDDPSSRRSKLIEFANMYGREDTHRIVEWCFQFYEEKIRPTMEDNRPWTRRSIKNWVESEAKPEAIRNYARRVLHRKLIMLAEGALAIRDPDSGNVVDSGEADARLHSCIRDLRMLESSSSA